MKYTEYQLIQLAQNNPQELIKIIGNHADMKTENDRDVAISAVDILSSEASDEKLVFPILNKLLKHMHATVRESALGGVSSFYSERQPPPDILEQLRFISENDPSVILKEYAKDLLSNIG